MRTLPAAVWFPTVRTGTGTDVFTERLAKGLQEKGVRAEIAWLPLRAEYAPWTVPIPSVPSWATVVHVNTWLHSRFLPKNLPVVATVHHAIHHPSAETYKGAIQAAYHHYWIAPNERRILRRANEVIAVSQFVANTSKETLLDIPMRVIYNGVNTEIFKLGSRVRHKSEPFRLLYVGGWKSLKGVDLLLPIMRELGNGFELFYTGGPAAKKNKANMPSNMYDIGRLNSELDVAAAMQNADALLFPSVSEGLPLVGIEAMACGLPIVGTDASSIPEVIEDNVTGILCETGNTDAFISAVKSLKNNPYLLQRMRTASRIRAEEKLGSHKITDQYILIYKGIT